LKHVSLLEAVEIFPNDELGLFANMIDDFELTEVTEVFTLKT